MLWALLLVVFSLGSGIVVGGFGVCMLLFSLCSLSVSRSCLYSGCSFVVIVLVSMRLLLVLALLSARRSIFFSLLS